MKKRIKCIYTELYGGLKTKVYFAELYGVTTKTIENTVAKAEGDIVFDRKLGGYRFKNLLPKYIPHDVFFRLLRNSISNEVIKQDFAFLAKKIQKKELDLPLISTHDLSSMVQKIIMAEVAIRFNCVIQMRYLGNKGEVEDKFVRPHRINTSTNTYYLYGEYDARNPKNVGEMRSFAINGIQSILPIEYIKDGGFFQEGHGNAYGMISKEKSVRLRLRGAAANNFKREGWANKEVFDLLHEEPDGNIIVLMYYNKMAEIMKLIQFWMPLITIQDERDIAEKVYGEIQKNIHDFTQNMFTNDVISH